MAKKSTPQSSDEVWRECHGLTDSGRLFVSSAGNVRFQPVIHHDSKTGRPHIIIDGRPIFLDSLVLSMFGNSLRPRRCYDISHLNDDQDNCSISNLEWTSTQLRNREQPYLRDGSDTNLSYLMSRTITPEMVQSREYPIVNPAPAAEYSLLDKELNRDVHSPSRDDSQERP